MTQPPSGDDPVVSALDELVRSGQLAPDRARAAYEASRGSGPPIPPGMPATAAAPVEPHAGPMRLDVIGAAIGSTLLATTVALSTVYARQDGLDWSNYALGILATLGLLGVAVAAYLLVEDDAKRQNLIAWPGALGALGVGLMIVVAMDDGAATGYVSGLATAAVSAGGYFVVRRGAFVISAILGLLVVYANLFDDLFGVDGGDNDNIGMKLAAGIIVYAVAVTAGGWLLPTRDVSGVFVGALAAAGFSIVLAGLMFAALVQTMVSGLSGDLGGSADLPDKDRYDNDVYVILVLTLLLVAGWAACSWLSGHVGYRVLILVTVTSVVPLASVALIVEHPSYWSLGFGIVGAAVLAVVGLRAAGVPIGGLGRRGPT